VSSSSEGFRAVRVLDDATVEMLARHWEDGWNRGDLETIMAPFAADAVFSSPGVSMMTGDPAKTMIEGADALRAYVDAALRRTRGIRYSLQATYPGIDSVVLVYTCGLPDGAQKQGADLMRVDGDGRVVEWRCHY
jgi:ketosteroid isomerase-like protein